MKEPRGYRDISVDWEPLAPGGHRCVIKKIEETKSSNGSDMIIISFDTLADDMQPMYFTNQYMSDKKAGRDPLRWHGTGYLVTDEKTEYGVRNLKKFNTAVCNSNPGFEIVWGDGYARAMEGKSVGIVFREEEYTKNDGSLGVSVKPMYYCDIAKALDQAVPERKALQVQQPAQQPPQIPKEWANAPVNNNGYWQPQRQPSTQMGFMQSQSQPQFQQQTFQSQAPMMQAAQEGFMQIAPDALDDEGLPFG